MKAPRSNPTGLKPSAIQDLLSAAEYMEANASTVNMADWVELADGKHTKTKPFNCGSTGCLAGHINVIHGYDLPFQQELKNSRYALAPSLERGLFKIPKGATKLKSTKRIATSGDLAARLLGLKRKHPGILFNVSNWPDVFHSMYTIFAGEQESNVSDEAQIARAYATAARIRYFVNTGE